MYPAVELHVGQETACDGVVVRRYSTHYSCSCPAWRFQQRPVQQRTCAHLRKVLGDEYENVRIESIAPGGKVQLELPRTPRKRRYAYEAQSPGTPGSVSSPSSTFSSPTKRHQSSGPIQITLGFESVQIGVENRHVRLMLTAPCPPCASMVSFPQPNRLVGQRKGSFLPNSLTVYVHFGMEHIYGRVKAANGWHLHGGSSVRIS